MKLADNLINMLNILHNEGYIHADIKLPNILIKDDPSLQTYFIDLAGLCKLPCTRSLPLSYNYVPGDFSRETKGSYRFKITKKLSNNQVMRKKYKTAITNRTFRRYSKELDKYAMGKVILEILDSVSVNDPRWKNPQGGMKEFKDIWYRKAYELIRYPIHIYSAEIGQDKLPTDSQLRKQKTRKRKTRKLNH